ncbi:hypothetical protein Ngar_c31490 [Candidatus Nitrososphaera gargensis Ga9.2]|uniref:SHOCT domain-containing protein n=1 Tax=Nitrososphaera gargensis (strain Ga9.2) TaxID=1237085 RepID=K0IJ84_NITGG|nr:SHOCT domain-containing protein [Candidatus Nitrososphaera gargensis]AFU60065.1 hypothetical protein Ngar_c31490 [Candidatus Nitrososphaera gargensis Ga9.2]
MGEAIGQSAQDHEVLWEGIVKIDPSISAHMPEAIEAGGSLKLFTITDTSFPYGDNAQLDNHDLLADFPNEISVYVVGGKMLEYMKCSVIKQYQFSKVQKSSYFKRKKQDTNDNYSAKKIVAKKGFLLSPVDAPASQHPVGCLASVKVSNEYGESLIFEKTGLVIFASGSKTSEITFTNQKRSVTVVFVASNEKPFLAYMRSKPLLVKLLCDSNGIKTEKILQEEGQDMPSRQKVEDPLKILKVRLAKGEISAEEYNKLRKLIADDEEKVGQGSNWI